MKVAIDAMGGDFPKNNIEGAIKSLGDSEVEIFLVGEPEKLSQNLEKYSYDKDRIQIIPSGEAIRMDEQPAIAIKRKPDLTCTSGDLLYALWMFYEFVDRLYLIVS